MVEEIKKCEDAPGWSDSTGLGPVCWKCTGKKSIRKKSGLLMCSVCFGKGRLKKKNQNVQTRKRKTKKRKLPEGYSIPGSKPL